MPTHNPVHTLIVPGFRNSNEAHWQTRWQQRLNPSSRTQPTSWTHPEHDDWINALDHAVQAIDGPIVIVAHSLGTITTAEWALSHNSDKILGALLVAIPDVQRPDLPNEIQGYSQPRLQRLPFPTIAALSSDDPYCPLVRGEHYARQFGARIERIGNAGHINHESDLGEWEAGLTWWDELQQSSSSLSVACG